MNRSFMVACLAMLFIGMASLGNLSYASKIHVPPGTGTCTEACDGRDEACPDGTHNDHGNKKKDCSWTGKIGEHSGECECKCEDYRCNRKAGSKDGTDESSNDSDSGIDIMVNGETYQCK